MSKCQAYQSGDEMRCPACGLLWDVADTDPPVCGMADLKPREVDAKVMRNKFERWAKRDGLSVARVGSDSGMDYASIKTQGAWLGFQAACALPAK